MKHKLLFCGYYGHFNTGDDAFCAISAWGAKHYWSAEEVLFLSRHLPKLPVPAKQALLTRNFFRGQILAELLVHLVSKPTVVFAGGSILHSELRILGFQNVIKMAQRMGISRIGGIGLSIGPFKDDKSRRSIRNFLKQFSFLALRDHRSFKEACSMNFPYKPVDAFDLAAFLPDLYGPAKNVDKTQNKTNPILGVSVCNFERYVGGDTANEERRTRQILETLKKISVAMPINIRFLVFNGDKNYGDKKLTEKIAATLSHYAQVEIVPYSQDPAYMWYKLGECGAVLANRLHAGIYSCFAGVPFLMIEYHQKCSDFLQDIQYPKHLRIGDMEVSPDEVASLLLKMFDKSTGFSIDVARFKEKARCNFLEI